MAQRVNPASLLSLDDLFTTESERNSKNAENEGKPRTESSKVVALQVQEHVSEQTVKKTFFLTQKNYDALKLHHMLYASTAREYSKIVNEALESYLTGELDALAEAEKKNAGSRKLVLALGYLSENVAKEK